jgi:hypothetical protein
MTRTEIERTARRLALEWWFAVNARDRECSMHALADLAEEHGPTRWAAPITFRRNPRPATAAVLLRHVGGKVGKSYVSNAILSNLSAGSVELRQRRHDSRPRLRSGAYDEQGLWYPDAAEEAGDMYGRIPVPTPEYRWRWWRAALTARHCRCLVERGSVGHEVPGDTESIAVRVRQEVWKLLAGELPPTCLLMSNRMSPLNKWSSGFVSF